MKQSTMDKKTWKNQGEKTPDLIERETRGEREKKESVDNPWSGKSPTNHTYQEKNEDQSLTTWKERKKEQEECGVRVGVHLGR